MDKIVLKDMEFYGHHGATEEEKAAEQRFLVDVELYCNLKKAGETDNIRHTVPVALVVDILRDVLEKEQYDLLEAAAQTICEDLFSEFSLAKKVKVFIRKPEADLGVVSDSFGVQVTRKR